MERRRDGRGGRGGGGFAPGRVGLLGILGALVLLAYLGTRLHWAEADRARLGAEAERTRLRLEKAESAASEAKAKGTQEAEKLNAALKSKEDQLLAANQQKESGLKSAEDRLEAAKNEAEKRLATAQAEAEKMLEEARAKSEGLQSELDALKAKMEELQKASPLQSAANTGQRESPPLSVAQIPGREVGDSRIPTKARPMNPAEIPPLPAKEGISPTTGSRPLDAKQGEGSESPHPVLNKAPPSPALPVQSGRGGDLASPGSSVAPMGRRTGKLDAPVPLRKESLLNPVPGLKDDEEDFLDDEVKKKPSSLLTEDQP